jgi:hypothetical protein
MEKNANPVKFPAYFSHNFVNIVGVQFTDYNIARNLKNRSRELLIIATNTLNNYISKFDQVDRRSDSEPDQFNVPEVDFTNFHGLMKMKKLIYKNLNKLQENPNGYVAVTETEFLGVMDTYDELSISVDQMDLSDNPMLTSVQYWLRQL